MKMTQAEFLEYAKQFNDEDYTDEKLQKIIKILVQNFGFIPNSKLHMKQLYDKEGMNRSSIHQSPIAYYAGFYKKVDYEKGKVLTVFIDRTIGQGWFYYEIKDYDTNGKFTTNKEAEEAIKKIKELYYNYDRHTEYIENYNQMKVAERRNELMLKEIDELISKF